MSAHPVVAVVALAALSGCTGGSGATTAADAGHDARRDVAADGGFVCAPPDGSTRAPMTFSGTRFDVASGCLTGEAVTLPVCGCFNATGKDSSTWCFVAPDGTTYFTGGNDGCAVEMPPGWYAAQTLGPSPFGIPTSAQTAACDRLASASTAASTGTYDRPGPPLCSAVDAGACHYPAAAHSPGDGSASGCRPEPGGALCTGFAGEAQFYLDCFAGSGPALDGATGGPASVPDPSLGCTVLPMAAAHETFYCCPCGS